MMLAVALVVALTVAVAFDELERRRRARGELGHWRERDGDR